MKQSRITFTEHPDIVGCILSSLFFKVIDMNEKDLFIKLGARIKKLRMEKGLRQEDMEEFGIAYKYYQRIESPASHPANITMKTMLKIANALEVEPYELFLFDD